MNQEWEIDSVDLAREETRVVQQRRERMPDRIADHAVNMRSSRKLVGTIEILHLAEGDLTGGSCRPAGEPGSSWIAGPGEGRTWWLSRWEKSACPVESWRCEKEARWRTP